jgi:hypothetical protein
MAVKRPYPPDPKTPIERLASRLEVPVEWLKQYAKDAGVRLVPR